MASRTASTTFEGNIVAAKPLAAFTRLSPVVALYVPPEITLPIPASSPTTILFCSWMNASPKHIDYYTRTYMRLYPSAKIILVTITTKEFLLQSETKRRADIKEAVTAILSENQEHSRLFVHALSNGGNKRLYGVAGAYRKLTGKALPVKAYILDSAPGIPEFRRDIHAVSLPARKFKWPVWLPFMFVSYAIASTVWVMVNWLPKWFHREMVWGPLEGIDDTKLVELCVKGYVYSKEDLAINWEHVERYAAAAERKGYRVVKKRIEDAHHVQLFKGKGGESDYWGFIQKICSMGMGLEGDVTSLVVS
jgi:hypothetical protein